MAFVKFPPPLVHRQTAEAILDSHETFESDEMDFDEATDLSGEEAPEAARKIRNKRFWDKEELMSLRAVCAAQPDPKGISDWEEIAKLVPTRTGKQCRYSPYILYTHPTRVSDELQ